MFSYGGFFVPLKSMSPIYSWVVWIDPINYAYRLVTGVVFGSTLGNTPLTFGCGAINVTKYPLSCGASVHLDSRKITSSAVLESVGTGELPLWVSALALALFACVTRTVAYLVLRWKWVVQVQRQTMVEVVEEEGTDVFDIKGMSKVQEIVDIEV
jgi:hypothetical protein